MKHPVHIFVLLLALMLSACATPQNKYDPIEPVNRVTDKLNDSVDRLTLKPVAEGYTAAVPKPMRTAVSNFYDNATYLNTVLNQFLQGKGGEGIRDLLRFLINTTLGVGGLVDVASYMGLERHEEDFGQTLAVWGMDQGAYIVYPLLGPNSVRKTPDFITSTATNPLFWAGLFVAPYVTIPVTALKYVDERARLLDASDMRDELALDPYVFTREAWRQNRNYEIHDGNPPAEPGSSDDDWEEDDWDSEEEESEEDAGPNTRISMGSEATAEIDPGQAAAMTAAPEAVAHSSAAAEPVQSAGSSTTELAKTDIDNQSSAQTSSSVRHYVIFLSSHYAEVEAAAEQGRLARMGIKADIHPVTLHQRTWYRLRLADTFADKAEARAHLEKYKSKPGLSGAWMELSR